MLRYYRKIVNRDHWAKARGESDFRKWNLEILRDLDLQREHKYLSFWETEQDHHAHLAEIAAALAASREESTASMYFRYVTMEELRSIGKTFQKRTKAQGGDREWAVDLGVNQRHREINTLTVGEALFIAECMMSGGALDPREEVVSAIEVLKTLGALVNSGRIAVDKLKKPPRHQLENAGLL